MRFSSVFDLPTDSEQDVGASLKLSRACSTPADGGEKNIFKKMIPLITSIGRNRAKAKQVAQLNPNLVALVKKVLPWRSRRDFIGLIISGQYEKAEALIKRNPVRPRRVAATRQLLARLSQMESEKYEKNKTKQCREAQETLRQAVQSFSRGNFTIAEAVAKKALQLDSSNPHIGKFIEDMPKLQTALARGAKNRNRHEKTVRAESWRASAQQHLEEQDYDQAATCLLRLKSLVPDDPWVNDILQTLPELREAQHQAQAKKEISQRRNRSSTLRSKIRAKQKEKDYSAAHVAAQELLILNPGNADAEALVRNIESMSRNLEERKQLAEAKAGLKRILGFVEAGNFNQVEKELNTLLLNKAGHTQAVALLHRLPALRRNHMEFQTLKQEQQRQKTIEQKTQTVLRLVQEKKFHPAARKINKLLALDPGNAYAIKLSERIKHALREEQIEPDVKKLMHSIGESLRQDKNDEAYDQANRLLAMAPDWPECQALWRRCHELHMENLKTKLCETRRRIVFTHIQQGNFQEAEKTLMELASNNPTDETYQDLIKQLPIILEATSTLVRYERFAKIHSLQQDGVQLGGELFAQGRYQECARVIYRALGVDSDARQLVELLEKAIQAQAEQANHSRRRLTPLNVYGDLA